MPDLISKRLRSLLADHFATNCTLREIEREFEEVGVPYEHDADFQGGGQRRVRVAGYYKALDFTDPKDARRFLDVLALVLTEVDRRHRLDVAARRPPWSNPLPEPEHPLIRLLGELGRCGYEWRDGVIVAVSASARLADTKAMAEELDLAHLGEHIQRIERSIDSDPRQAIGSAKEMIETVCKTILRRRGDGYSRGDDMPVLGKKVFAALKQLPDDVPEAAKGAATVKRTLSNLMSVVQGVAELRGLYGTGHGQDGATKGLGPRHARLAVGAAATLAYYLLETDRDTPVADEASRATPPA